MIVNATKFVLYMQYLQGDNVAFGLQILHHKIIVARIAIRLGGFRNAINYLNKCLYYVNIGSNDYINNYYLPQFYPTSRIYNTEQYAEVLIKQYSPYIKVYLFQLFIYVCVICIYTKYHPVREI